MKELDYIIVGLGIAGLSFCEQLQKHNKRFIVYDNGENISTKISAGMLNPVLLKRFTLSWKADKHMSLGPPFYKRLSEKIDSSFWREIPVFRILSSIEEQNDWVVASDKIELAPFLSSEIHKNENSNIKAPFGYGKVKTAARVLPSVLLDAYKAHLLKADSLLSETFEYDQIIDLTGTQPELVKNIRYKEFSANKIIFAEGIAAKSNPFFPKGPFQGGKEYFIANKGEFLIIKAPQLKLDVILKGPIFIIPLGNDMYKVGATYKRNDTSVTTSEEARDILTTKLKKMIRCDFEIVDRAVGIRPTTKDRRPFLGSLPHHPNKVFLNGLGTHGIMNAPYLAEILYNHLENDVELPAEMDIRRML